MSFLAMVVFGACVCAWNCGKIMLERIETESSRRRLVEDNLENLQRQLAEFEFKAQSAETLAAQCARIRRAATEGK